VKRSWVLLVAVALVIVVPDGAAGPSEPSGTSQLEPGSWPVFHEMEFITMTSDHRVSVDIYYPGYDRWLDKLERDDAAPFEVIIFSPGAGGDATAYEEYLTYWASWGFVVAGVSWTYEYNRDADVAYRDHGAVLALLDQKGAEGNFLDPFFGVPNTDRAGAVGHSRGGRTAFMATSQESRILCASAWMPTLNNSSEVGAGAALQLFGGDADEIAPPGDWLVPLYDSIDEGVVYIEVFGGDHGTDESLHPVMALDLFRFHLKGDGSVESGLQGDDLKGRADSGEFRLRMKLDGDPYDSHPDPSPEPTGSGADDRAGTSGVVIFLLVILGGGLVMYRYPDRTYKRVFRGGPRKRE
jgi:dienelactone hydrolase